MSKYKLEDLKVGAVFKAWDISRTILMVGKADVFFSSADNGICRGREYAAAIDDFLSGCYGELVKPDIKTEKIKTRKGTLAWAMVQLAKGLKVRHKYWACGRYVYFINNLDDKPVQHLVENDGWLTPAIFAINAIGWELYEEKEEKII